MEKNTVIKPDFSKVSATRSRNMAAIRANNTRPEMKIRQALHASGLRYRLYDKQLAGKPDLVLKKYKTVIFVQGCFWHKHDCKYFKWPKTNAEFWQQKILNNAERDAINIQKLLKDQWRVCVWWECSVRHEDDFQWSVQRFQEWLNDPKSQYLEL
ncbi:very short patch repair endonuclease [Acinetobacter sp. WCHAc010052]|uniref:very short patch repair endonuclease n=1 Tax=Acinetobacter sp. WCHAc010052 TaxID=2004647 RepID=UPI000B3BEEFC|nr:very short patch repair endonuclease [Acinetobacter sp. WCHAc010052]AXY60891.1 DNA mismatch endonuclease Vsr [Acinetobacter sp. WCHAc010052]